jgi:hypothetical protein
VPSRHRSTPALLLPLSLLILATGGCRGWQFGSPTLHRLDIRSVHVPVFESGSWRRFLGQRLTEAVVKEIELNTPFTVTSADRAQSILSGRIIRERKRVLSETEFDDARTLQYEMAVEVTWTDRGGVPLMERQVLRLDRDVTFIPESGQSLITAQQEILERFARQIVDQMEMPW